MNDPSADPSPPHPEIIEAEQVLRLPGHLFFVDSVELPPALESGEIADFAELTVESIAPFPLEQLNWGFLHSADSLSILIYAAHRDRLKKVGADNLDAYAWVLPDFASLHGAHFPENTEITLVSEECVTLLHYEAGAELPKAVSSLPLHEESVSKVIASIRDDLEDNDNFPRKLSLRLVDAAVSEQGLPTFQHAEEGTNNGESFGLWAELSSTEKSLWQADVRNAQFKESERSARRTGGLITKVTLWAALCALLLVGLEVLLLAGNAWLNTQANQIATQRPTVARIEDRQTLMNKLEQVAQNELRPIAILDALNNSRPDGIYFTSTETEGQNRITIDGIATTINDLNRYTGSLSKSGTFALIGTPKSITRSGKTTFTATLDYTHQEAPKAEAPTTEKPQTSDSEPTEEKTVATDAPQNADKSRDSVDEAPAVKSRRQQITLPGASSTPKEASPEA
ncbi:MAG: PilN domain-containing protein [Lentimonas sp.]